MHETEFVKKTFSNLKLRVVEAKDIFFKELAGISDPEEKRRIIGRVFIEIFEKIAKEEKAEILVQGTIYPDRIESGITKHSANIKSHHNVGGLPEKLNFEIYEPLRNLYKDEVRRIAKELGLPDSIITRHVFPGPGLAVRVLGEVTKEKVEIARKSASIIEEELKKAKIYTQQWMAFSVVLPIKSVGIQGDERTYKYVVVVRIIQSKDAMTANFSRISYEILDKISTRITNEIKEVNRVVYDITNKPPATMEWE
jgi:GMP synthase (glutamine-hydrolysing)